MFGSMSDYLQVYFEQSYQLAENPDSLSVILSGAFFKTMGLVALLFFALLFAAVLGPFAQVGFMLSPEVLKPGPEQDFRGQRLWPALLYAVGGRVH